MKNNEPIPSNNLAKYRALLTQQQEIKKWISEDKKMATDAAFVELVEMSIQQLTLDLKEIEKQISQLEDVIFKRHAL